MRDNKRDIIIIGWGLFFVALTVLLLFTLGFKDVLTLALVAVLSFMYWIEKIVSMLK